MREDAPHAVAAPSDRPVPGSVRAAAWTFLLASVAGFVGGILELATAARTGALSISVPVAAGVTGLALFRGLLRGAGRAWRWARWIAGAGALGFAAMMVISLVAPEGSTFSVAGRSWPMGSVAPFVSVAAALACVGFLALFRALGRPAARRHFDLGSRRSEGPPVHAQEPPAP